VPIDNCREKTFEDLTVTDPKEREKLFGQRDHVRIYGKDYKDRLKEAGFFIDESYFLEWLENENVKKYSLLANEDIFYCTKELRIYE
jgi:hypothetical protein